MTAKTKGKIEEEKLKIEEAKKHLTIGYFPFPCVCKHPLDYAIISATQAKCLVCGKKL